MSERNGRLRNQHYEDDDSARDMDESGRTLHSASSHSIHIPSQDTDHELLVQNVMRNLQQYDQEQQLRRELQHLHQQQQDQELLQLLQLSSMRQSRLVNSGHLSSPSLASGLAPVTISNPLPPLSSAAFPQHHRLLPASAVGPSTIPVTTTTTAIVNGVPMTAVVLAPSLSTVRVAGPMLGNLPTVPSFSSGTRILPTPQNFGATVNSSQPQDPFNPLVPRPVLSPILPPSSPSPASPSSGAVRFLGGTVQSRSLSRSSSSSPSQPASTVTQDVSASKNTNNVGKDGKPKRPTGRPPVYHPPATQQLYLPPKAKKERGKFVIQTQSIPRTIPAPKTKDSSTTETGATADNRSGSEDNTHMAGRSTDQPSTRATTTPHKASLVTGYIPKASPVSPPPGHDHAIDGKPIEARTSATSSPNVHSRNDSTQELETSRGAGELGDDDDVEILEVRSPSSRERLELAVTVPTMDQGNTNPTLNPLLQALHSVTAGRTPAHTGLVVAMPPADRTAPAAKLFSDTIAAAELHRSRNVHVANPANDLHPDTGATDNAPRGSLNLQRKNSSVVASDLDRLQRDIRLAHESQRRLQTGSSEKLVIRSFALQYNEWSVRALARWATETHSVTPKECHSASVIELVPTSPTQFRRCHHCGKFGHFEVLCPCLSREYTKALRKEMTDAPMRAELREPVSELCEGYEIEQSDKPFPPEKRRKLGNSNQKNLMRSAKNPLIDETQLDLLVVHAAADAATLHEIS